MEIRTKQLADKLGVTSITIYRWLKAGKIPEPPRDRNGWRVWTDQDVEAVEAFARQTSPPTRHNGTPLATRQARRARKA